MKAHKVRSFPARTFHEQIITFPGDKFAEQIYVKNGYKLVPCTGEAHSNPHIDNCMSCLSGTWGWKLVRDEAKL